MEVQKLVRAISVGIFPLMAAQILSGCSGSGQDSWKVLEREGTEAYRARRYDAAVDKYKQAFKQIIESPVDRARISKELADAYLAQGKIDLAQAAYDSAVGYLEVEGDRNPFLQAQVLCGLAACASERAEPAAAQRYYKTALSLVKEAPLLERQQVISQYASFLAVHGQPENAAKLANYQKQQSLKLAGNGRIERRALRTEGAQLYQARNFAGAESCFRKALELSRSLKDTSGMAEDLLQMGLVSLTAGNSARAELILRQSVNLFESLQRTDNLQYLGALNTLGIACVAVNKNEDAVEVFSKALHLYESETPPDKNGIFQSYQNLAVAYRALGDEKKAVDSLRKAYESVEKSGGLGTVNGARGALNLAAELEHAGASSEAVVFLKRHIELLPPDLHQDAINEYASMSKALLKSSPELARLALLAAKGPRASAKVQSANSAH